MAATRSTCSGIEYPPSVTVIDLAKVAWDSTFTASAIVTRPGKIIIMMLNNAVDNTYTLNLNLANSFAVGDTVTVYGATAFPITGTFSDVLIRLAPIDGDVAPFGTSMTDLIVGRIPLYSTYAGNGIWTGFGE